MKSKALLKRNHVYQCNAEHSWLAFWLSRLVKHRPCGVTTCKDRIIPLPKLKCLAMSGTISSSLDSNSRSSRYQRLKVVQVKTWYEPLWTDSVRVQWSVSPPPRDQGWPGCEPDTLPRDFLLRHGCCTCDITAIKWYTAILFQPGFSGTDWNQN